MRTEQTRIVGTGHLWATCSRCARNRAAACVAAKRPDVRERQSSMCCNLRLDAADTMPLCALRMWGTFLSCFVRFVLYW